MGRPLMSRERGGALLSVLWLTAALAAIAFSVATLVRAEVDRAGTNSDGARAYFLARGGMERYFLELEESPLAVPGIQQSPVQIRQMLEAQGRYLVYPLPEGEVHVEMIPEAGKLDLNAVGPLHIERVLLAMGVEADRIQRVTAAILDWRGGGPPRDPLAPGPFDALYLSRQPSFRPPRASFQEIEELLLVEGMTPELYYGGYHRTANGNLVPHAGMRDCFTTLAPNVGPAPAVDVLSAAFPVLVAGGMMPQVAEEFVRVRQAPGFLPPEVLQRAMASMVAAGAAPINFAVGGRSIYTLRSTARLRTGEGKLSDTRRSVSALVKFFPRPNEMYQILRWDDQAMAQTLFTEANP